MTQKRRILSFLLALALVLSLLPATALAAEGKDPVRIYLPNTMTITLQDAAGGAVTAQTQPAGDYNLYTFDAEPGVYTYRADGYGSGQIEVSGETEVYLRPVTYTFFRGGSAFTMKAVNTENEKLLYQSDRAEGIAASLLLPALGYGVRYVFYFQPEDERYVGFHGNLWVEKGTQPFQGFKQTNFNLSDGGVHAMSVAGTATIRVPHGATLQVQELGRFYRQVSEYDVGEPTPGDDYDTYTVRIPAQPGGTLYYLVSQEGMMQKGDALEVKDNLTVDLQPLPDDRVNTLESSVLTNGNAAKFLNLADGETFALWSSRVWQAINDGTSNKYIEPPKHYTVLGDPVVTVNDYGIVEPVPGQKGIAVVALTYDAMEAWGKRYDAISDDCVGVFAFQVGGTSAGITSELDTFSDLNTFYYAASLRVDGQEEPQPGKGYYAYSFHPQTANDGELTVQVANVRGAAAPAMGPWQDAEKQEDGSFLLKLTAGRNVVKVSDGTATRCYVLHAKASDVVIENLSNPGQPIQQGDKLTVGYSNVATPQPKLGAIYNPGFGGTVYLEGQLVSGADSEEPSTQTVRGAGVQYTIGENSTIPVSPTLAGTATMTNVRIHSGSYGSAPSTHLTLGPQSEGGSYAGDDAPQTDGYYCNFEDVSFQVLSSDFAAQAEEVSVKIDAIGDVTYDEACQRRIAEARGAYAGAPESVRNMVPPEQAAKLEAAETAYLRLMDEALTPKMKPNKDGAYELGTADELLWFARYVNGTLSTGGSRQLTANAVLTADITLGDYELDADGELTDCSFLRPWTPIAGDTGSGYGASTNYYGGTFDGQGHTIRGLYLVSTVTSKQYVGMFGALNNSAIIRNLTLENCYISGATYTGAVNGYNGGYTGTVIENVHVQGSLRSSDNLGGIAGGYYGGIVRDCSVDARMSSDSGSVAGIACNGGRISRCSVSGTILSGKTAYAFDSYASSLYACRSDAVLDAPSSYAFYRSADSCYFIGSARSAGTGMKGTCYALTGSLYEQTEANPLLVEKDAEAFASGEVACALGDDFGQKLTGEDRDEFPVLNDERGTWAVFRLPDGSYVNATAEACDTLIGAIGTVGLDGSDGCFHAAERALACYRILSAAQRTKVTRAAALTAATNAYNKVVRDLVAEIEALLPVTVDSEPAIDAAQTHYDAYLAKTGDAARITNYAKIATARKDLETARTKQAEDKAFAGIETERDAEGNVTLYKLDTKDEVFWFIKLTNGALQGREADPYANALLTADITVNENLLQTVWDDEQNQVIEAAASQVESWPKTPNSYYGTFDGGGHTISGVYAQNALIAGNLTSKGQQSGQIKNLRVVDSCCRADAIFALTLYDGARIDRVGFEGVKYYNYGAGLCDEIKEGASVSNSYFMGKLVTTWNDNRDIGGIAGEITDGTVSNCYVSGTIRTPEKNRVGAIAASATANSKILNCWYEEGTAEDFIDVSSARPKIEGGGAFTAAQRTGGELCYHLGETFGQKLNTEDHPLPGSDVTVYKLDDAYVNAGADAFRQLASAIGTVGLDGADDCFTNLNRALACYEKLSPADRQAVASEYAEVQKKNQTYRQVAAQLDTEIQQFSPLSDGSIGAYESFTAGNLADYLARGGETSKLAQYDAYLAAAEVYPALRHRLDMQAAGTSIQTDESGVYLITDENEFAWFVEYVNGTLVTEAEPEAHPAANAKLAADLRWNLGADVIPAIFGDGHLENKEAIARMETVPNLTQYDGVFDGQGHTLTGLVLENSLFKTLTGTVKDLNLRDTYLNAKGMEQGGLVGDLNGGTVENCTFEGAIKASSSIGGIAGSASGAGSTIRNARADALLLSTASVTAATGGILGNASDATGLTVDSCYSAGKIVGIGPYLRQMCNAGGILGYLMNPTNSDMNLMNCYSTMTITDIARNYGGIFGYDFFRSKGEIRNNYYMGSDMQAVAQYGGSRDLPGVAETRSASQLKDGTILGLLYGNYVQRIGRDDYPIHRSDLSAEELAGLSEEIAAADAVEQQITDLLEKIETPDKDDDAAITAVETAYNQLGDGKWLVRSGYVHRLRDARQALADIDAAAAVVQKIDAIGDPVTLASEEAITAARQAYDALTANGRTLVSNADVLTQAEQDLQDLKLGALAQPVEDQIAALGSITLDSEDAITAAREAYNALAPEVKPYVSNYATLQKAERTLKTLQDDAAGAPTEALIDAIGDPVTPADAEAIEAARRSYDALTGDQQALVDNYDKLTRAEAALEKLQADTAAAQPVIAAIDEIGSVTLNSGDAIEAARKAYDALTEDQQALVTNYRSLTQAEAALEKLRDDVAAADTVQTQIGQLGQITLDSGDALKAAREAYDALTEDQQAFVTNLPVLTQAEQTYAALAEAQQKAEADEAAAQAVDAQIAALGEITADSGAAITAARNAYNALTPAQKALVRNVTVLQMAERLFDALTKERSDLAAAQAVDEAIAAIGEVTLDSGETIKAVRTAYNALTLAQKDLVKNLSKLEAGEKAYDALVQAQREQAANEAAAKAVTEKIEAIGEVTLNSSDAIEAARNAYEALTDAQKALVENLSKLEAAEKAYAALVQAQQEQAADKAAAKAVTEKIDAIGEVTLDSGNAIEVARNAYEALTDAQKALVENLPVLEAAEKAYAALQTEQNPFADVESGSYYYDAVLWAAQRGIAKGITDTTFCPQRDCTRGQIVTFLWRAFGKPTAKQAAPFTDVKIGDYCYEAVQWAVEQGITTGVTATSFQPQAVCTRAQVVTFLWRAKGKPEAAAKPAFTDLQPDAYYLDAVAWAVANDVTTGVTDTTFCPERVCTRGQIATFLHRALTDKEDRK